MTLTFDKIKDLIGINGTVGVDLLGSARVRDNLFVSGYLTVGGKKFTGLNINGVKAIDKDVKWKGEYIEIEKGGTGKDLSDSTGAIQISEGSLTAGTLDIDKGGTGDIVETNWKNSYITTNDDGTLNYDKTTATAPTLTRIAGTLTIAKGGTGEVDSDIWKNSRVTVNNDGTLNYDATTTAAPNLVNIAGTLTVAKGGTGDTDSDIWLNSRVKVQTDGTLKYDNTTDGAVTMNTLTDANNIRSRLTAGLASNGDVARTVAINKGGTNETDSDIWLNTRVVATASGVLGYDASAVAPSLPSIAGTLTSAKGGTGQDFSGTATGFIKIVNGTASQRSFANTKTDLSLNNVENKDSETIRGEIVVGDIPNLAASKITSGQIAIANGGTNAANSNGWLNSRITTNANGTLNYDATSETPPSLASIPGTVAKAQGGFGADASTVSVALITNNLDANGLKAGRTLGDGLESQVIFHDSGVAGTASGAAAAASTIWQEGAVADTYVIKVVFNYQHQTESVVMRFVVNLRCTGSTTATAKLEIYAMNSGGTAAAGPTGSVLASATATHDAATYAMSKSGDADISGLTSDNIYRCEISLKNDRAAGDISYMTGLVITTAGA